MARSKAMNASGGGRERSSASRGSDAELLARVLDGTEPPEALDKVDSDEAIAFMVDAAMRSLERTNAVAAKMVTQSRAFRKKLHADLGRLGESQRETRRMIEDLVNG